MEAEIKQLLQMFEESKEEDRAARARAQEASYLKVEVLQNFIN